MTAEWVTAVATAGTFVVIAASAMAALIQLRHMRGSNQIVALTDEPSIWEHFEYLAALSMSYMRKHVGGSYPSSVPRMPGDRSFIEAVKNDPETV